MTIVSLRTRRIADGAVRQEADAPEAPQDRHESVDRRRGARDSPSLMMLVLIAFIGVLLYTSFVFNVNNRGDWIPYLIVVSSETVIIFQVLLSLWTILSSGHNPRGYRFHNAQTRLYGSSDKSSTDHKSSTDGGDKRSLPIYLLDKVAEIDVYITTYGEDLNTIRRTVAAALAMDGRHNTTFWTTASPRTSAHWLPNWAPPTSYARATPGPRPASSIMR